MSQIKIFDTESFFHFIENLSGINDATWFFLGKDYGELKKIRLLLNNKIQELDISDIFQQSVNDVRESFVEYLADYAEGLPLCDQYSSLIERGPLKSDVFLNFCYLYSAKGAVEKCDKKQIIIICLEPEVAWDLKQTLQDNGCTLVQIYTKYHPKKFLSLPSLARTFFNLVRSVTSQSWALLSRHLKCIQKQNTHDFSGLYTDNTIFIHTWASESSISTNGYKEIYYSDLSEKLAENGFNSCTIIHLSSNNKIIEKKYFNCLKGLNNTTQRFFPEECFITISSIVKIWKKCLFYHVSIDNHKLLNIDFTWCAFKQNYDDWKDCQLFYPLTTYYMIKGISAKKIPVRSIIILHENYNAEKTLILASHRFLPSTTIIGYQHSTVTPNYLFYNLATDERTIESLPDYIITNGEYPSRFLKKNNYPENRIITGGALRYVSSTKNLPIQSHLLKHNNRILITLPIIADESVEILEKVFEATKDNPELEILVKIHPFLSQAELENNLPAELIHKIHYVKGSLNDILPTVNVLVYSTTSTCIEALSFGIPVLKIKSERRLDMDPLEDFQGTSRFISAATQPKDIKEKLLTMRELELTPNEKEEIQRVVRDIFGHMDAETYLLFTRLKGME